MSVSGAKWVVTARPINHKIYRPRINHSWFMPRCGRGRQETASASPFSMVMYLLLTASILAFLETAQQTADGGSTVRPR